MGSFGAGFGGAAFAAGFTVDVGAAGFRAEVVAWIVWKASAAGWSNAAGIVAVARAKRAFMRPAGPAWNAAAAAPKVARTNADVPHAASDRRAARAQAALIRVASAHGGRGAAGRSATRSTRVATARSTATRRSSTRRMVWRRKLSCI